MFQCIGADGEGQGALAPLPPPHFLQMVVFLHANARHSKPKVASRCRHAANIAFDLFNIFLYVIARKVRKCPLSPFVTSNVVLSCLVQKADSLSALQLTGALFTINWGTLCQTHLTPPIHPTPQPPPPPPPPLFGPLHRPCSGVLECRIRSKFVILRESQNWVVFARPKHCFINSYSNCV